MDKMEVAEKYYNKFSADLTSDYVEGNPRTEAAIQHILNWIPLNVTTLLDVGCGIGWTSFEVAKNISSAEVFGVDLSPESIKIAQKLFKRNNLHYEKRDITVQKFEYGKKFDAVFLVDVYEHIPAEFRPFFHKSINEILKDGGRLILTCPSILQQKWIKQHKPEGLQPVDEEIGMAELHSFAQDVEGEVIFFSYKQIWDTNDYFHAVIEKNPKFKKVNRSILDKIKSRLPFRKMIRRLETKRLLNSQ